MNNWAVDFPYNGSHNQKDQFYVQEWNGKTACQVVNWTTPYSIYIADDYKRCVCDNFGTADNAGECAMEPVDGQSEDIPSEDTPVPSEDTPVPSEDTPVESEDTPVESEDTPVESEDTPVESEDTPVESEDTPVESEDTPVESESEDVPLDLDNEVAEMFR